MSSVNLVFRTKIHEFAVAGIGVRMVMESSARSLVEKVSQNCPPERFLHNSSPARRARRHELRICGIAGSDRSVQGAKSTGGILLTRTFDSGGGFIATSASALAIDGGKFGGNQRILDSIGETRE
jgi:hypothetical protein